VKNYAKLISEYVYTLHPELGSTWIADEMCIKVRGEWMWLWTVMDMETRFIIAQIVSSDRMTEDAIRLFRRAMSIAKVRPRTIITDGLHAYEDAVRKVFWTLKRPRTVHERVVKWCGGASLYTNLIERLQGTIRERLKVLRGLKKENSPIINGYRIYYNFIRPHESLDGRTPSQMAELDFGHGEEAWMKLIIKSKIRNNSKF